MTSKKIRKQEKDNQSRKMKLPRYFWFRQFAIYPPSLALFAALFGLIYLLNYDMLVSVYAIPFVLTLILSAIWLKMAKKYILGKYKNS
ncbi:hypothetical protein [Viscerimonas tarda]